MGKLRVLVVGSGWGLHHGRAVRSHPEAELVGLCGRSESTRSLAAAAELQVPLIVGLEPALEQCRPDVVCCCTAEAEHATVTIAALEAGAHVLCEKMTADSLAAAERMVAAAERAGRRLGIGYNYRFSPSARKLRELVESGSLGGIVGAQALCFGYCLHHTLDLVCSLLGEVTECFELLHDQPPEPPSLGFIGFDEFVYSASACRSIQLRFASGAVASLVGSDFVRPGHPAVRLDLLGTRARCTMADIVGAVTVYRENREAEQWLPSLILDRLDLPSTTEALVRAFIDAIRDGHPPPVTGEEGLARLRLEAALARSAREGVMVGL